MRFWATIIVILAVMGCGAEPTPETADTGAWEAAACNTDASLRGLSVVNDQVAWASGSGGTFVRTADGGLTWSAGTISGAESLDLRDVHGWSADRATVISAGHPGKIFLTEDAGRHWAEVYSNETEGIFFNSMAFWDMHHGIAVGDPLDGRFLLIRTDDGGRTWAELPFENRPEALPNEANFAASGTCLAVAEENLVWFGTGGPAARVFRSVDRGNSWQVSETPLRFGEASQGVFGVLFLNPSQGIIVGGDYLDEPNATANVAFTRDGGETWSPVEPGPAGFRECVTTMGLDPNRLMTVGPSGSEVSIDGGLSWQPVESEGRMHAADFSPEGNLGVAVGAEGLVAVWRR